MSDADTPPSGASPASINEDVSDSLQPHPTQHRRRWRRRIQPLSAAVGAVWLIADQATKIWAVERLSDGRVIDLVGSLRFSLSYNSGMAFGRGQGLGPIIGVVALVVVVYLLIGLRNTGSRLGAVSVGLVMGGAAGNVCDRLFRDAGWLRGSVVDFIDLQWWPVFNIADVGVTVGGLLLVLSALRSPAAATDTK